MQQLLKNTEEKMEKTIAALERDYKAVRAGRANASILDRITVDYYGVPTPIQQMAAISMPEPRILMIKPWDASTLKEIEKAILVSEIGINPQNDGTAIRLNFPPLTEERRKEVVKEVKKMAEDAKVSVRNIRRDALEKLKAMKKNGEITDFTMRVENSKYTTVKALQSVGFEIISAGDSYNDLGMLKASKKSFLFFKLFIFTSFYQLFSSNILFSLFAESARSFNPP